MIPQVSQLVVTLTMLASDQRKEDKDDERNRVRKSLVRKRDDNVLEEEVS